MFGAVGVEFLEGLLVGGREFFGRLGQQASGGFGGGVGLQREQFRVLTGDVEAESSDAVLSDGVMSHDHDELGAGRNGGGGEGEDRLTRDAVLGHIAADGPAGFVVVGLLRLTLAHRSRGQLGDAPAGLVVIRFCFRQRDVGGLAVGRKEADFEAAEYEVSVEGAAEALAWMGVVGQRFEAYRREQAGGERGFEHVGLLGGRGARDEPGAVVEALERGFLLGGHLLVGKGLPCHAFFGEGGALTFQPLGEELGLRGRDGLEGGVGGGERGARGVDLLLFFHGRKGKQGRGVATWSGRTAGADIDQHAGFVDGVEVGEELVELLLRNRVVFVVVAAAAVHREPHPGGTRGLDAVDDVLGEPFFDDATSLAVKAVVAVEGRGHDLVAVRFRQEVAGELFDREGVERLVAVEGFDDPVSIGPHRALGVALETVRVGVAGEVEPLYRHVLAVVRRSQQAVEGLGPGFRRTIGEESLQVGIGRRQAGQVEGGAAEQRGLGGIAVRLQSFGGEALDEESIDRVAAGGNRRDGRFDRNLESPVALILGAFLDPAFDQGDLIFRKHLVELRRRHVVVGVVGAQSLHHFAGVRFAGDDRGFAGLSAFAGSFERVEAQAALDLILVGAVAGVASVREDRSDVPVELHFLGGYGERPDEAGSGETKTGKAHGVSDVRQLRPPRVHSN